MVIGAAALTTVVAAFGAGGLGGYQFPGDVWVAALLWATSAQDRSIGRRRRGRRLRCHRLRLGLPQRVVTTDRNFLHVPYDAPGLDVNQPPGCS